MADDLDDWIKENRSHRTGRTSWEAWPQAALDEIARVLEHNDAAGVAKVPLSRMVERLHKTHGCSNASANNVRSYCRRVLKRRDWGSAS